MLELHEEESPGETMREQSIWRAEGCRVWHYPSCRRVGIVAAQSRIRLCLPCEKDTRRSTWLEVFSVPAWVVRIFSYEFAAERSKKAEAVNYSAQRKSLSRRGSPANEKAQAE